MKKIGIVTIESLNYGNRLQNYALQEVVKSLGYNVETIRRVNHKALKQVIKRLIPIINLKANKMADFNKLINFSDFVIGRDDYPETIDKEYDYFICGSDQIWNPLIWFAGGKCDFLQFASHEKRISYAASFGINEIPDEYKDIYSDYLKCFHKLSVREEQGVSIIKNLADRDAEVVLDPTMLLSSSEWKRVAKKSRYIPIEKYVLVYLLGPASDECKEAIEYYSKTMKVFNIRQKFFGNQEIPIGPAEFLYAIEHASIVLTDSFHCTVFSVIFERPVYTFNRVGIEMSSRIKTLHSMLGIFQTDYKNIEINMNDAKENIEFLKVKSLDYLKRALHE